MPKWPRDPEAMKRKAQTAFDIGWGFFLGVLSCVLLSLFARNC